jgi:hypothetical protein
MVKPVYGFVSDTFPIFGMRRKPYFFLFGALGFACYMAVAAYTNANAFLSTLALLGGQCAICGVNVLAGISLLFFNHPLISFEVFIVYHRMTDK